MKGKYRGQDIVVKKSVETGAIDTKGIVKGEEAGKIRWVV